MLGRRRVTDVDKHKITPDKNQAWSMFLLVGGNIWEQELQIKHQESSLV